MKIDTIIMKWSPGLIYNIVRDCVELASVMDCRVQFEFNKVDIVVSKHTDVDDAARLALAAVGKHSRLVI